MGSMKPKYWRVHVGNCSYPCEVSDGRAFFYSKEIPPLRKADITREDVRKHIKAHVK